MKRGKLRSSRLFRARGRPFWAGRWPMRWPTGRRIGARIGRFLVKSRILALFVGLCLLGIIVGVQTRPSSDTFPHAELFDQMRVLSYRDSPGDSTPRFVVQLCAGDKVFSQYDIATNAFLPPPSGREYTRTITGTHYGPLRARGHVGYGFWLEVPRSRRTMLPEQFDELYRTTLDFVKPVSRITGVLGVLSGYSVGYRIGTWNGSLASHAVQQRVLATPDLGRMVAREAWRRVLLEPVVMTGEEDAGRFAAITGTQRLYDNFFRLALADSEGFIPHEAERLEHLGHAAEARAMRDFAAAARRAASDAAPLGNADFDAVERWATLLDRRGHWVTDAIPPSGEERMKLLGTLAWYGLAPPGSDVDRVWVGPRMLVHVGDVDGFVADEILRTGAGCPTAWRGRLREDNSRTGAMVRAWLADRPEFAALFVVGRRAAGAAGETSREIAAWWARSREVPLESAAGSPPSSPSAGATFASRVPIVTEVVEPVRVLTYAFAFQGGEASIQVLTSDSTTAGRIVREAQSASGGDSSAVDRHARAAGRWADAMADTLRAHGMRDALVELPGVTVALGKSPAGEPWSLTLRDPGRRIGAVGRLRLAPGQATATASAVDSSGTVGLVAATVLAADAATAAAWSSALLALGPAEARAKIREHGGLAAVLIERRADGIGVIWVEAELKDWFVLDEQAPKLFRVERF